MKLRKAISMLLCVLLMSGMYVNAEELDTVYTDEIPEYEEVPEVPVNPWIDADEIPDAEEPEDVPEYAEGELPEEEQIPEEEEIPEAVEERIYAVLRENTTVYNNRDTDEALGIIRTSATVLLPDGYTGDKFVAVQFAFGGEVYTGMIKANDIADFSADSAGWYNGSIPVIDSFEIETESDAQLTPEAWIESRAKEFFPKKATHEDNMLEVGSMDLGIVTENWLSGGITPSYAYVDCSSSMMIMNQPVKFTFNVSGFTPSRYVYSIYSQDFDSTSPYYYSDVYMETVTSGEATFTPMYSGRYFLLVYVYDAAGNYVYFDSMIYETAESAEAESSTTVYGKARKIISEVTNDSMDDYEKALALHDWLVLNVSYATSFTRISSDPVFHPVGALLNGSAVCEGYAEAYRLLLKEVGIESTIVVSNAGNHAWNLVKINGGWYHVDCTWDDPVGMPADYIRHTYFMLTDAELRATDSESHIWNEKGTSSSMVPASATGSIGMEFSNETDLLRVLRAVDNSSSKVYLTYNGSATTSQLALVRSCVQKVFPNSQNRITQNGKMYIVTITGGVQAEAVEEAVAIELPEAICIGLGEKFILPSAVANAADTVITYSTSDSKYVTVNASSGLIRGIDTGNATITASAGGTTVQCKVTVEEASKKISLSRSYVEAGVGESFKLANTMVGASYTLTWSSDNSMVATVDEDGIITAVAPGEAVISVRTFNGKTDQCKIVVKAQATSMSLPQEINLGVRQTYVLSPVFEPANAGSSVTYALSKNSVIDISPSGVITALARGNVTVTARDYSGNVCKVRVSVSPAPTAVVLKETSCTVAKGEKVAIEASVSSGSNSAFTYESTDEGIVSVDANGIITPKSAGKADIIVSAYNGKQATCSVTVKEAPASVTLAKSNIILGIGETFTMKATMPRNSASGLTWTSTGKAVSVNANGVITAKALGKATVRVMTFNGLSATCVVNVVAAPNAVVLNADGLRISAGKTYVLSGSMQPTATAGRLTYTSSNPAVAAVNDAGKITARRAGTASISVETYNGTTSVCEVTVVRESNILEPSSEEEFIIGDSATPLNYGERAVITVRTITCGDDYTVELHSHAMENSDVAIDDADVPLAATTQTGDLKYIQILVLMAVAIVFATVLKRKGRS